MPKQTTTQTSTTKAPYKRYQPKRNPKKRKVATVAYVQKALHAHCEKKLYDAAVADYPVDTTGSFKLINGLTKGTGLYGNRIGAQIRSTMIEISGQVGHNGWMGAANCTTTQDQVARMIVVRDKQCNGAIFSLTDLLDTATSLALYQGDDHSRYQILLDKSWICPATTTGAGGTPTTISGGVGTHIFHFTIKLDKVTQYNNGDAGTVADIDFGALWVLWVGTQAAGATTASTARYGVMHHYCDA